MLDALPVLGATLDAWQPGRTDGVLAELISMLRNDLLPHARAEALLYPAVEQAMGAPGAMATMVADHREIARRVEALAGTAAAIDISAATSPVLRTALAIGHNTSSHAAPE